MMADGETAAGGDAVPLSGSRKSGRESEKNGAKRSLRQGFCVVPSLLPKAPQRLGLGPRRAQRHIAALKGVGASDLPPNGGPLESSLDPRKQNPGRIPNGRGGPGVHEGNMMDNRSRVKGVSYTSAELDELEASLSRERLENYLAKERGDRAKAICLHA